MRGSIHGKSCLSVQVPIWMSRFAPTCLRICKVPLESDSAPDSEQFAT